MKNIFIIILFLLTIISCGTSRKFSTSFFEEHTTTPQKTVDSIVRVNSIPALVNYRDWIKSMYFSSDSVVTTQYLGVTSLKDTTYIFSITEFAGDSIFLIKFRKE